MHLPLISTGLPSLRRGVMLSVLLHAIVAIIAWKVISPTPPDTTELVDIEIAPPPPPVEALPAEVARLQEQSLAAAAAAEAAAKEPPPPPPQEAFAIDAGVPDAPPDAAPADAAPKKPKKKHPPDAAEPMVAEGDAGAVDDGAQVATTGDAGAGDGSGAPEVAMAGSGSDGVGSGAGSGEGSGSAAPSIALAEGSGSGVAGATTEPAVEGAPTTAGTAANLLTYFPPGHVVTALIRFDRLRGTEWAAQTERLLRPMPDYGVLFGPQDARIADKLDTLVISSPKPRDATATTLVAHTAMGRPMLRDFLGATSSVAWTTVRGGLLGTRSGHMFKGDHRVFLSPFKGWFLLAQPTDLGTLTKPTAGDLDAIEATGRLPAWLAAVRKIETESGSPRGPALVLTIALGGTRVDLAGNDFGLGVSTFPTPDRISLAMELVKQGWLVRGNMRFAKEADAIELVAAAQTAQQRVADSRVLQMALGKPVARVIANLSFARTGGRVSYATSISIADARQILAAAAQQLDMYYGPTP